MFPERVQGLNLRQQSGVGYLIKGKDKRGRGGEGVKGEKENEEGPPDLAQGVLLI